LDGSGPKGLGVEVWKGGVTLWECDTQGHLNVRFYVAKAMEGLGSLAAELGMPRAFSPTAASTLRVREVYVRFLREARAGAQLSMRGGVLAIGDSDARLLLIMQHATGEPAAAFQIAAEHVVVGDGRATPWPPGVLDPARRLTVEAPAHAQPRTLSLGAAETSASLERARALNLQRTGFTVLRAQDCDAFGRMRFDDFLGRIGDGMPGLAGFRPGDPAARRTGSAAVEYRLILFDAPRAGDRIDLRSAVVEVTSHYRRTAHWLLDPETGRAWGVAANVGVGFDLETRKFATLAPEQVAAAQGEVVAELRF